MDAAPPPPSRAASIARCVELRRAILTAAAFIRNPASRKNSSRTVIAENNDKRSTAAQQLVALRRRYAEVNAQLLAQLKSVRQTSKAREFRRCVQLVLGDPSDHEGYGDDEGTRCEPADTRQLVVKPEHFGRMRWSGRVAVAAASPWEGTVYKLTLVVSLRRKLLLKLGFEALALVAAWQRHARASALSCGARRQQWGMQRCFLALVVEAKSASYIAVSAAQTALEHLFKRFMRPAVRALVRARALRRLSRQCQAVAMHHRAVVLARRGWDAWATHRRWRSVRAWRSHWSTHHAAHLRRAAAFLAWAVAAVRRRAVRAALAAQLETGANRPPPPPPSITVAYVATHCDTV